MSYRVAAGSVYQLSRSLRHPDMFGFTPGQTEPNVVEIDEETAQGMNFTGALVYIDGQTVAVFEHSEDKHFILGMPVDPNDTDPYGAPPEDDAQQILEEILPPNEFPRNPTGDEVVAWGHDREEVCECGYYLTDHMWDGEEELTCPSASE
jgi:hypothetical protein